MGLFLPKLKVTWPSINKAAAGKPRSLAESLGSSSMYESTRWWALLQVMCLSSEYLILVVHSPQNTRPEKAVPVGFIELVEQEGKNHVVFLGIFKKFCIFLEPTY